MRLSGLHHVTCVCSNGRETVRFYRELGFRLVKKTVNFDDPESYHLYLGDDEGSPGTLITFFEWPGAERGAFGLGTLDVIALAVPGLEEPRRVEDPDGLRLELVPGEAPAIRHLVAFGNPDLYAGLVAPDGPLRFQECEEDARIGVGVTHHVAFRAPGEAELAAWQEHVRTMGLPATEVLDRKYFRSVYFRMPDGLLIEVATDEPGFAVDEPAESLGSALALPDWLEDRRPELERALAPLD